MYDDPTNCQPGATPCLRHARPVATAAGAPEGHVLKLTHKDGTTEINVPSSAPVWTLAAGDKSLVKTGLYVVLTGQKQADGSILAPSITIEKDGFKPPN